MDNERQTGTDVTLLNHHQPLLSHVIYCLSDNVFTALNNFISKTVIHRKEKYNTYINANLNGKNNCWITKGKNALTNDKLN